MQALRLFTDLSHLTWSSRQELCDLLRPLSRDRSLAERAEIYGEWAVRFELVPTPAEAHAIVLPLTLPAYGSRPEEVRKLARTADLAGKPLLVFAQGDPPPRLPADVWNAHVYATGAYASRRRGHVYGLPPFLSRAATARTPVEPLPRGRRPIVGFCGQASVSPWQSIARTAITWRKRAEYRLGKLDQEPPPFEHTRRRARLVEILANSPLVDTRFVLRRHYLAREIEPARAEREFVASITDSHYTLCYRGVGNFSLRFFEVLALGRVPLLVNTDCLLPCHDVLDWRKHVLWVEEQDWRRLPELVADHHRQHRDEEFQELQRGARQIYERFVSAPAFFERLRQRYLVADDTRAAGPNADLDAGAVTASPALREPLRR